MSDVENNQAPLRGLTRTKRALLAKGLYFAEELKSEVEDALRAIAIDQGYKDSRGLDELIVEFRTTNHSNNFRFVFELSGYFKKPGDFIYIVDKVKRYAKEHNIEIKFEKETDQRMIVTCAKCRPLIDCLIEGFINSVSPENAVDYDAILARDLSGKTWAERISRPTEKGQETSRPAPSTM